jgi:hypothetical protein
MERIASPGVDGILFYETLEEKSRQWPARSCV